MKNTRLIPKTLGIPESILRDCIRIAAEWDLEKLHYEKPKNWADVARYGMRLAIDEHLAKAERKRKAPNGKQLSLPKKKATKKKSAKKKPPMRSKAKPKKKATRARGRK